MHIPENYLSPSTCALLACAAAPVWYIAVGKVKKSLPKEHLPLLGAAAALSFLAMMFNLPLPGGTTGHAVGAVLIAIVFGPWAACLAVSAALAIQAIFFGDGGILAIGANCFNMAIVMPFVGYGVYKALNSSIGDVGAAAIAGFVGINAAAAIAGIEFGIQPALFHDEAGQALYFPYGLEIAMPAMMIGHLTLFGLAEAIFTAGVLAYIKSAMPELLNYDKKIHSGKAVYGLVIALIALTPLGLLAEGTAWGEWGADELATLQEGGAALGYTPAGIVNGLQYESPIPDYGIAGMPDIAAYLLSAIIGASLMVALFKVVAVKRSSKVDYD